MNRKDSILNCRWILALTVSLALATSVVAADFKPPVARIVPHTDTLFGDVTVDNYFWLRHKEDPEVIKYLQAENAYADSVMKPTEAMQKKLYDEMLGRIKETDLSVPVKHDNYYYYSRTEQGRPYPIICRKKGSLEAPEEVILDINKLAQGHDYFAVGVSEVSPDQQLMAYSTDTAGSERFVLRVKNLATGELYPEAITNTYYALEWAADNATFFYTVQDSASRAYRLYRHKVGSDPTKDALVYEEPDEAYSIELDRTKDRAYILMNLVSEITSEVRYLKSDQPEGQFTVVHPRQHGMEYDVEHHDNRFIIRTNDNARNFKVVEAPESNPSKANWKEIIPGSDSTLIRRIELFKDFMVVYERKLGLDQIRITNFKTNETHDVSFDEPVYTIRPGESGDFDSKLLRFSYTSLVTPSTVYDYDMEARQKELKKQQEVLGGYDPKAYQEERLWAKAPDGVMVPISLVYKKGLVKDGNNPTYLYGYGAYGISSDPSFSSTRLSLLDRGFVYAIAHVRGGAEMGRQWYEDGRLLHKKNTFTDFIACAEHLIAQKYTSSSKLVIDGASAGGLLIGAVVTMRPDLFKIALPTVPFVDIINTMSDPSLPATVVEYEEWGNPGVKEDYEYMKTYSPYDNVGKKAYPTMLVRGGLSDPRVSYWEPAKFTAKLRVMKTDNNLLLLKTNMESGHFGSTGRYGALKDAAYDYAFIFMTLGITK
ncbi:MAG TPA: S9 family peptidase [Candidatus Acidoferrum sp.]|nr:S9 family peptidase [Candidatus Acidoferrum sp.]